MPSLWFYIGIACALLIMILYVLQSVGATLDLPKAGKATEVFLASLTLTQAPQLASFALFSDLSLTLDQRIYILVGTITMGGGSLRSIVNAFKELSLVKK